MADKTLPRPRQVTLLGAVIMGGSAFVVLLAFDQMASLGSIEAQESAARLIAEPPASGLGLSVDDVQSILRVLCVVAGGAAAATAILGWQVLQRARSARLALSILAPVLLVAGTSASGFLAAVVVAAIVMLWVQPARDWFAGVAPSTSHPALTRTSPPASPSRSETPAAPAHPAPPVAPAQPAAPSAPRYDPASPRPSYAPVATGARPAGVLAAVITTIVSSTAVLLGVGIAMLVLVGDRPAFESEVAREVASNPAYSDLEAGVLVDVVIALLVVFALWAVAAVVLAVLALRRSNGARIALVVSAIGAAMASLLGVLVVAPLLVTAASVGVAVLLLRKDAGEWYARRGV